MGGRARRITIKTRTFDKHGDAVSFFRGILQSYSNGHRVCDEDMQELLALLERHDEKKEKKGSGISHFYVDVAPEGFTRCFWISRTDGSVVDFSFMHCLEKKSYD